ncbi:hypothetical protein ACKLNO_01275 [Neisseriaceae bacterium B1]
MSNQKLNSAQLSEIDSKLSLLNANYEISNYKGQILINSLIHGYECFKAGHFRTIDAHDSTFEELNRRYEEYLINSTDYFSTSAKGF